MSITKLRKSWPMYLLYIYFIFKSTKILPYFAASNQHFTRMPEYIKHKIWNNLQVIYIYNKNHLHHFSIFYNISILSFLSLCESKCVAWKIFHIYFFQVWIWKIKWCCFTPDVVLHLMLFYTWCCFTPDVVLHLMLCDTWYCLHLMLFILPSFTLFGLLNWTNQTQGKLMMKHAPEWVWTGDPVISGGRLYHLYVHYKEAYKQHWFSFQFALNSEVGVIMQGI